LELDLGDVVPSLAGPKRPQDRVSLADAAVDFLGELSEMTDDDEPLNGYDASSAESFPASDPPTANGGGSSPKPGHVHTGTAAVAERSEGLDHGAVVIAAITSCTNTSNPSVMIGAGLLAKKAVEAGLTR